MVIFLTFSPTYIILTISYEGLFYFVFCITLVVWVELEHRIYAHTSSSPAPSSKPKKSAEAKKPQTLAHRTLVASDARIALFFFFLLQSAFFSTGNIASISSFSLDSVSRLIPVFSPFSQSALLIFKILIPFAVISANLGILNHRLGVAPSALFMVVMAISDVMTLNFFYMVRDDGSWLEIGMTISHFCIASALCVFVAGLEFLSEALIAGLDFVTRESGDHGAMKSKTAQNGKATRKEPSTKKGLTVEKPAANGSAPTSATATNSSRRGAKAN